ncbi:MotE family protein [Lentibacillus salinarum]|uniref:MotE family protein n=1 Tax=Lentibacillus salinarum TaxID=446820 RepID=A0ABW3ZPR5_9BACI
MAQKTEHEKKKINPLLWFLFAIVIPAIVAITLVVIILMITGVDVVGWAKEKGNDIPVLAEVVTNDEEKNSQRTEDKWRETIAGKDEEIASLNQEVSALESTNKQMEQEIAKLENEQDSVEEDGDNDEASEQESIADIASSFSDMDNEQAAQILQNVEESLAVSILADLPSDARGDIFEAMEPDAAAGLTQQFVNQD